MYHYAGIDVSLESSTICVVDGAGKILRETKVASEPEALIAWFRSSGPALERSCLTISLMLTPLCGRRASLLSFWDATRPRCLQSMP